MPLLFRLVLPVLPACVVAVVELIDQLLAGLAFGLKVFDLRQALDAVVAVALGDQVCLAAGLYFAGGQATGGVVLGLRGLARGSAGPKECRHLLQIL